MHVVRSREAAIRCTKDKEFAAFLFTLTDSAAFLLYTMENMESVLR